MPHLCRPAPIKCGAFLICRPGTLEKRVILRRVVPRFPDKTGGVMCPSMGVSILPLWIFSPTLLPVRRVDVAAAIYEVYKQTPYEEGVQV